MQEDSDSRRFADFVTRMEGAIENTVHQEQEQEIDIPMGGVFIRGSADYPENMATDSPEDRQAVLDAEWGRRAEEAKKSGLLGVEETLKKFEEMGKKHDKEFRAELCQLLNKYGMDTDCGTPDFILADLLGDELQALARAEEKRREYWRDRPRKSTISRLGADE